MSYAIPDDVVARWGKQATPEEIALIDVRLGDVERMIRRVIPDLDDQVDAFANGDPGIDVNDVKQVESDAVLRLARNPEGYLSESDGSYTYQFRHDLSTGSLSILPNEWLTLGVSRGFKLVIPNPEVPA